MRRRYHLLLALRFVPTGLFITVFVLLLRDRGFSLAEIGVGTAAQGVTMLFLELPSGGLADALGRKPVLVLAGVFSLIATSVLLVADTLVLLAVVSTLQGIFRALDSGPLQSWFIDASLAFDPGAEIERDLARSDVVICASIGVGALLGGLIVRADGLLGVAPLVAPLVAGMAVQAAGLIAVLVLMDEVRPGGGWVAARRSVAAVPTVVTEAVRLIRASTLLTALVVGELLWGFGMLAFETLMPPRLAEVSGGVDEAASLLGPALTAAWVLSALGAAVAPWLVRRFGPGWAGFGLRLAHGGTVVGMGLATGPAGLIVAYLGTYWVHGATAPVHYGMVHRAVESSHRATVVSANSLTSQIGGAASGILLGALADATSITTAMLVAAGVLAAAAPLYLVGRTPADASYEEAIPLKL
ncbi:MAG: putative transporter [Acidimicrobiales bacterium]|nr:putative transporter [Acidimicrobiales bacterium]